MKTLLTSLLLGTALLSGIEIPLQDNQTEMYVLSDEVFESKVKVYDYEGNLLKEMRSKDVANDEISIADYFILENSGFAFSYLGDHYYLRD